MEQPSASSDKAHPPNEPVDSNSTSASPHALATGPEPPHDDTAAAAPAVRFVSAVDVAPDPPVVTKSAGDNDADNEDVENEVTADELKAFTKSLHGRPLQTKRMNTYQFEAFSLPASRVPSRDDESGENTRFPTPSSTHRPSPHGSPSLSAVASPPLTPAGSGSLAHGDRQSQGDVGRIPPQGSVITPEPSSGSHDRQRSGDQRTLPQRPASTGTGLRRATSAENLQGGQTSHRRGMFQAGAGSVPVSRESSPSRREASNFYSKPATPFGDANDPYAKNKRAPQAQFNRQSIDPRFVFSRKKGKASPSSSRTSLSEKRASGPLSSQSHKSEDSHTGDGGGHHHHHPHGSMADLKRFFRKGGSHKHKDTSPAPSHRSGTKTPPSSRSTHQLPFDDDNGLASKYGKLGKVLGSGAGGSVRLMKRKEDGTVFAVKEFRARHPYETEKEYSKKVTAEFCVGSTLHHGNIIETLDILSDKGRWFEVMEYAPFDMFAIVMTGKMSREEVSCCFLQILNGVTYLHSVGLAHRDLKLDNVVVSDKGIMKIIDFGSAHVFKYPFESAEVPAKGIVGSDPYLAPEVYDSREYDAKAVDIWSLAIIFCCMSLRRFPWKIPKMTDNSFKMFAAEPTPGHDPNKLIGRTKSPSATEHSRSSEKQGSENDTSQPPSEPSSRQAEHSKSAADSSHASGGSARPAEPKREHIRGPWRILRLLPRESRHIIHRMLDLNPKTRAGLDEILEESWVADTVICQQLENGEVISAEDHEHILEPHSSTAAAPPQKN